MTPGSGNVPINDPNDKTDRLLESVLDELRKIDRNTGGSLVANKLTDKLAGSGNVPIDNPPGTVALNTHGQKKKTHEQVVSDGVAQQKKDAIIKQNSTSDKNLITTSMPNDQKRKQNQTTQKVIVTETIANKVKNSILPQTLHVKKDESKPIKRETVVDSAQSGKRETPNDKAIAKDKTGANPWLKTAGLTGALGKAAVAMAVANIAKDFVFRGNSGVGTNQEMYNKSLVDMADNHKSPLAWAQMLAVHPFIKAGQGASDLAGIAAFPFQKIWQGIGGIFKGVF